MEFDLALPEGCPRADVGEYAGIAFRVVQSDPPTVADLQTYLELNRLPTADMCKRGSVSLFASFEQAEHLLAVSPRIGKFIACMTMTSAHGRVGKPSRSGHIDWWPYFGMRRPADLTVIRK